MELEKVKEAVYEKSGQWMNCNKDIFTLIFAAVSNTNILGSLFLYELWYLLLTWFEQTCAEQILWSESGAVIMG